MQRAIATAMRPTLFVSLALCSLTACATGTAPAGGPDAGAQRPVVPDAVSPETPDATVPDIDAPPAVAIDDCASGTVTYSLGGNTFRLSAAAGQQIPENLTTKLDALSPGSDAQVVAAPDSQWLIIESTRFDPQCDPWACLAVVDADVQTASVLKVAGQALHTEGLATIASGGNMVVFAGNGATHARDLMVTSRDGDGWSPPVNLTEASPYSFNDYPSISADGNRVVFDCGDQPYGADGTAICEVGTDGSGFRVVWTADDAPPGYTAGASNALHSPSYSPDGSIFFEADWSGEQVWRIASAGPPTLVGADYANDNSPCVLPNGCVVSLWLGRPGGNGHELKIMQPDGSDHTMLQQDVDVSDFALSCGE